MNSRIHHMESDIFHCTYTRTCWRIWLIATLMCAAGHDGETCNGAPRNLCWNKMNGRCALPYVAWILFQHSLTTALSHISPSFLITHRCQPRLRHFFLFIFLWIFLTICFLFIKLWVISYTFFELNKPVNNFFPRFVIFVHKTNKTNKTFIYIKRGKSEWESVEDNLQVCTSMSTWVHRVLHLPVPHHKLRGGVWCMDGDRCPPSHHPPAPQFLQSTSIRGYTSVRASTESYAKTRARAI